MEAGASSEDIEALRRIEAAQEYEVVEQALAAARDRLNMDAAYVTTVDAERQVVEGLVGRTSAPLASGVETPIEETYCARMLRGEVPNIVPNTRADPALRELAATRYIGAYVGVPVRLSDGRVHGTLCCVNDQPCERLGEAELRFMEVLARIVATRIERAEGELARLTERLKARDQAPEQST